MHTRQGCAVWVAPSLVPCRRCCSEPGVGQGTEARGMPGSVWVAGHRNMASAAIKGLRQALRMEEQCMFEGM